MKKPPLIRLENISKSFGRVKANSDINLSIHGGRIKALLGENGAGKSTLMHILAGSMAPDSGRIIMDGKGITLGNTKEALDAGIGMVYQHFMLVEAMTVVENVFLGQVNGFFLKMKKMVAVVRELAEKYGLEIDPLAKVSDLSMGEKQRVEILKLLMRKSRVLIFDEPTAVLTPKESESLFKALRQMASRGKGIVFISHKLQEVMDIADDISILSKGTVTYDIGADQVTSKADLARRMIGREVLLQVDDKEKIPPGNVVLDIQNLISGPLKDVSLNLRQGEILGVVGVAGNGQKPLVSTVCGLSNPKTGNVNILGKPWKTFFSRFTHDKALCYIPEDRLGLATCPELTLLDNFLLTTRLGFSKGPFLQRLKAGGTAKNLVESFKVTPPSIDVQARRLSGGNLQKMVLAREFYRSPRLIVAEQPTQGLDIAATEEVWNYLLSARRKAGVLLVTGDLSEALALCDRIAVMYEGRIMDIMEASDSQKIESIGLMMAGINPSN